MILTVSRQIFTYFHIYILFSSPCIVIVVMTQEARNKIWESLLKIFLNEKLVTTHLRQPFFSWSLIFQSWWTTFVSLGGLLKSYHFFSSNVFAVPLGRRGHNFFLYSVFMLENSSLALITPATTEVSFLLFSVEFIHQIRLCSPLSILFKYLLFLSFIHVFQSLSYMLFAPFLFPSYRM